ncbi:MAG: hypothetical protein O7C59_09640, partial [Rickettsia endosymbiont of Ixodes persulcatus]|nr:hypothetical protein [Rickettsia endosymbiont of Ixodes persulcatus]
MIIEALTAFGAGEIIWEALEILHLVHVGHITGKASYKGGRSITHGIQQLLKKWQDQSNPDQQREREAETPYDFKVIDDATHQKIKKQAGAYLTTLKDSVWNLNNAKKYFSNTHGKLKKLANALDEHQFAYQLLKFNINFESFKDEFNQFLLSIKIPPRQLLYIASLSNKGEDECGVIKQFNGYLASIKTCFEELEKTKKNMVDELKKGFDLNPTLFPVTSSGCVFSVEQLQQGIKQCMHNSGQLQLLETIPAILSENTELATLRTAITQISAAFQQTDTIEEQTSLWADNPNWRPLLTEEKQVEVGQRIFLHAMSEELHSGEEKLLLAQIFLRQYVSKYVLNQVTVDLLAHELASILCGWQLKKCEQLTAFLKTLAQGAVLPERDPDGLLEWLKTKRRDQSSIELFKGILVSPYCFGQIGFESAVPSLKDFLINQAANELIRNYKESYWGAIREKNDTLIQLPKSFDTKILPRDCIVEDEQAKDSNVVSDMMHQLAKKLITDLAKL